MLTVQQERSPPTEIDVGSEIWTVTFTTNGEYLVSGDIGGVQVWRTEDGKHMATMETGVVRCLAVSKDGRWIAAGARGRAILWDAKTYEEVFTLEYDLHYWHDINGVDFSPNASRLVAASENRTAIVWDVATGKQVQTLRHQHPVRAAKYSPQGDRFATATHECVRVWDSNDGCLLVEIKGGVTPSYKYNIAGLLWFSNHLFAISDSKIKEFDASSGLSVSEWPIHHNELFEIPRIALPHHGEFIACATHRTISFWDTSTRTQLGLIEHPRDILSIAFSPDDRFLAIGGLNGKITIKNLKDDLLPSPDRPVSQVPFINITNTVLDSWRKDRLEDVEASLTKAITNSGNQSHFSLANRALVRARLRQWDLAIDDAEKVSPRSLSYILVLNLNYQKSIEIRQSIIGYTAKSIALIGGGKKEEGCRVFDLVFRHCHPNEVDFLLLIKVCIPHWLSGCLFVYFYRQSSCLWPGNMLMQPRMFATSSLRYTSRRYVMW